MTARRGASGCAGGLLGPLAALLLVACGGSSGPAPDSGFLEEPQRLEAGSDRFPFDRVWMAPDFDRSRYTKIWVKAIDTRHLMVQDWADKSQLELSALERGANGLARYMHNSFRSAFYYDPNRRLQLAERADADTLILETALVEAVPNNAVAGALGLIPVLGLFGDRGSVAMESRLRDGGSQQVVGMLADRRQGRKAPIDARAVTWYGHAEEIIDDWAIELVRLVNTSATERITEPGPFKLRPW